MGQQKPADLASIHQPVLVMNGDGRSRSGLGLGA
jgi:hypothetical protein